MQARLPKAARGDLGAQPHHILVFVVNPQGRGQVAGGHNGPWITFGTCDYALQSEDQQVAIRVNSLFVELLRTYQTDKT